MKRQIKFRTWDESIKRWVGVAIDTDIKKGIQISNITGLTDKIKVMQYTGLKDKNGKEIYEGDIIILHEEHDEQPLITKYWKDGFYLFTSKEHKLSDEGFPFENMWHFQHSFDRIKVIGNIYENKELLK